jgi:hypothetical protein
LHDRYRVLSNRERNLRLRFKSANTKEREMKSNDLSLFQVNIYKNQPYVNAVPSKLVHNVPSQQIYFFKVVS